MGERHFLTVQFLEGSVFIQLMAARTATVLTATKYPYLIVHFITPYIGFSILLSDLYIFNLMAASRADSKAERIGALVLEVKGDFCHNVRSILEHHGRGQSFVEVKIGSVNRNESLHNNLDSYALAYSIPKRDYP